MTRKSMKFIMSDPALSIWGFLFLLKCVRKNSSAH